MKKFLLVLGIAAAASAAVYVVAYGPSALRSNGSSGLASQAARARQKAPWEPYGFQLRSGPDTLRYDVPLVIAPKAGQTPNVRVLLDVQDPANYYFVEFTQESVRIGKVESGLEDGLGASLGQGLQPGRDNLVVVKRRYDAIEAVLNDLVVARAEDESFHRGQIGAGVLGDSATVRLRAVQSCYPIFVTDDFMKGASEERAWQIKQGSWQVSAMRNPSLSSNAFDYLGSSAGGSPPATAVRGEWFWDDYRCRAACASWGKQDVGLYFYYRDPENYFLFRWNADRQDDGQRGRRQLVKRWHGQETVLAEAPGGYVPQVWHELEVQVAGPRVVASIDGHEVLQARDDALAFGLIGLYSATPIPIAAHFDDVTIQTITSFEDDFSAAVAGRWTPLKGSWDRAEEGGRHVLLANAAEPAKAVAGSRRWRDYRLAATVRLPGRAEPGQEVGLVGHYLDETNYVLLAWAPDAGVARLEARVNGQRAAFAETKAPSGLPGSTHTLELAWKQAVVEARLDGQALTSAFVPGLPEGRIGLYAANAADAAFSSVGVAFPPPPERVPTHQVFEREKTMEIWAGASSDWEDTYQTVGGRYLRPHWHRADLFGDATIEVEVKGDAALAGAKPTAHECRLVLAADSTKTVASGYGLLLAWGPAEGKPVAWTASLSRLDKVVDEEPLTLDQPLRRVRLQRIGRHVIASVNDQPVLAYRDEEPLAGCRAAYATHELPVDPADVSVYSDNLMVYTFSRAATDWRAAAGTWEISNRWQCDPRWSFFSGVPDSSLLAALWNKRGFEGDVSVEFAVGPKMDSARGGSYQYARDFNVTLCADGRDLTSGYSFLFGGWDNSVTAITREGKIVARSSYVIPRSSGIHRRWFYIKVEKRGNTLTYWVDGAKVLSYTDPEPLAGNRVAIWSWDCGLMVSRVRISASAIKPMEPPGTPCSPCKTLYTMR